MRQNKNELDGIMSAFIPGLDACRIKCKSEKLADYLDTNGQRIFTHLHFHPKDRKGDQPYFSWS